MQSNLHNCQTKTDIPSIDYEVENVSSMLIVVGDIIWTFACFVFLQKFFASCSCIVKFFQTILKQFLTLIHIHECIPLPQAIKLIEHALEEGGDTCVVSKHKPANSVVSAHVRRPTSQGNLYRSRSPWNEVRKLAFPDAE